MVRLTITPRQTETDVAGTCPVCEHPAKLNELVRSAYRILGCHNCYGKTAIERPSVMVTRALVS